MKSSSTYAIYIKMSTLVVKVVFLLMFTTITKLSQQSTDDKKPFRSNKINMIWTKAQNKMSSRKLNELRQLFDAQDQDEMNWKKKKASGGDEDGMIEAKLRKNLIRILKKHGMQANHVDEDREMNRARKKSNGDRMFGDKRLDGLWSAALKQGKFSDEELEELEAEFGHHKDKVAEYDNLQRLLSKHDVSISENTVLSQDELKGEQLDKLEKQMKDKQREVYKDFVHLKKKVVGSTKQMQFEDERVNELWQKALNKGFSTDELQSIREELSHFDHKILKHRYYQEQAKESEKLFQNGQDHLKHKHEDLKKKVQEHGKWVEKMHKTMLNRVTKTEL